MDAFITRKKRKSSPNPSSAKKAPVGDDDEPTDVKLAILASRHPHLDQETLFEILIAHDGLVSEALSSLQNSRTLRRPTGIVGPQSSLKSFATVPPAPDTAPSPKKARLLSRKGKTLFLYDPADIAEHTPCTIVHNFAKLHPGNHHTRAYTSMLLTRAKLH